MEIKKIAILTFAFILSLSIFCQNEEKEKLGRRDFLSNVFKINTSVSGVDLSYEFPIKYDVLLETQIGLGAGYKTSSDFKFIYHINHPSFYAGISAKYYYRINRKRKVLPFNNDFFWGFKLKYISESIGEECTWQTAFFTSHWGIQKKLYRRFSYQFTIGIGFAYDIDRHTNNYFSVFPDANFKLSYAF